MTWAWKAVMCLVALSAWASEGTGSLPGSDLFRVGISYASFGTVNRNDASAALKAWASAVAKDRQLHGKVQVEIYEREIDLREALKQGQVQAASMTAEEFLASGEAPESIFVVGRGDGFGERYVLIVRRGDHIKGLEELKGRKLVRHLSPLTAPAWLWLQAEFGTRGLGSAQESLSTIALENPSKSVFQVFFHQADACLVTSNSFAVACELNPQLCKELEVLISSPPLVPSLFFFRTGHPSPHRQEFEEAILQLHKTATGQQVLTIFQGSRFEKLPLSSFETTGRMLSDYHRLSNLSPSGRGLTKTGIPATP
jgi:ABC-type phosphate/phosphonate transport system substrate-binding protein